MIVISDGSRAQVVTRHAPQKARDFQGVVDDNPPRSKAMPRLVELCREDLVLVEMSRLDRQVGRLERAATLLVDDVEGADQPDVVAEVGDVAGPSTAVEVADEGRPADGAEHEVGAAEDHVALRVPSVQLELGRRGRDQIRDLRRIQPDGARRPIHRRTSTGQRFQRPVPQHLHPDLGQDPQRRAVDRLDLVRRQDLDRSIRVHKPSPRELADPRRPAPRPAVDRPVFAHVAMLRGRTSVLRWVSASAPSISVTRRICRRARRYGAHMRRKLLALAVLVAVGVAALAVGVGGIGAGTTTATEYLTANAAIGDVTDEVAATGSLAAATTYGLAFGSAPWLIEGDTEAPASDANWPVNDVAVKPGDTVTEGQVLATVEQRWSQALVRPRHARPQDCEDAGDAGPGTAG